MQHAEAEVGETRPAMMALARGLLALITLLGGCSGPPTLPAVSSSAFPEPTPSQDISLEIAEAIARRQAFGLRADPEYVAMVAEDPMAVMSEFGMLLLPEEVDELNRRMQAQIELGQLQQYGLQHPDQFGGMYIDNEAGGTVVLLFTNDVARHAQAAAALAPPGVTVHVRSCRHTEAELAALLEALDFEALRREGYDVISAAVDTIGNLVALDARSNIPDAKARLEARYGGMLQANIYPVPGPWQNTASGEGWRLLVAGQVTGDEAYTVRAAINETEWQVLWDEVGLASEPPVVDLAGEIVVSFGSGFGSGCTERRLDGVVIDRQDRLVHALISDPLAPRACTSDLAGAAVFVIAVAREGLPASPFTLQLGPKVTTCGVECGTQEQIEVSLDR